jgi:hypothetical protein
MLAEMAQRNRESDTLKGRNHQGMRQACFSRRTALVALICFLTLALLAGCGMTTIGNSPVISPATPTATRSAQNPISTAGAVTVTTDRSTYAPTDSIHASVVNGLSTSIFVKPPLASCAVLGLEIQQPDGTWQTSNAAGCAPVSFSASKAIPPSTTYTATITAGRGGPVSSTPSPFIPSTENAAFPVGTYRLVLYYTLAPPYLSDSGDGTMVTSAPFQVR